MPKYPFLFIVLLLFANAYGLELELNQKSFKPGDKLVIFGTAAPNDSLIIQLFNPTGNLIYRSQLDININGEFAAIILAWPEPDEDRFRVGTYTLVLTSSINPEESVSQALIYQLQEVKDKEVKIEKQLDVELSIPTAAEIGEEVPIIAYVTLNDAPLIGLESIKGSIRYPDDREGILNDFITIGDGLYKTSFISNMTGYHTIVLTVKHQELLDNKVSIIDIDTSNEEPLEELSLKIASLDQKLLDNANSMRNDTSDIKEAIGKMDLAIGQLTSLLLPIVGMIAIIVALQATILAKRK